MRDDGCDVGYDKKRRDWRMIKRCLGWVTGSIYCHEEARRATDGSGFLK